MRSVFYTTTAIAGVSTLVPHAKAMAVAAATDITLAALDLFANIVVLTKRPKVGIRYSRGQGSSRRLHDD